MRRVVKSMKKKAALNELINNQKYFGFEKHCSINVGSGKEKSE